MNVFKKAVKVSALIIFSLSLLAAVILFALLIFTYKNIDFDSDEALFESSRSFNSTTFYAKDDSNDFVPIETSGAIRKMFYSSEEISDYLKEGIVSVEDKIFYEHHGVDVKRTLRAALNYLTRREKIFGASTITQQVVKNISGDNDVKLTRKLAEIIRARHIEKKYSKDEILELYLNIIPMSENIYGVGAASRAYFGKEPSDLTPEEAAILIGITNAPTAYNPYENPEKCKKKRDVVLSVMYKDGIISSAEYEEASASPIFVIPREEREDRVDSWFVETVIDDVSRDFANKYGMNLSAATIMLLGGGYSVYTTMDVSVQETMEAYFENTANFPREITKGLNFAMTVTDSESGDLVGIVGRVGEKRADRLLNHATVPHIPGSTLKPLGLYAPLIDEGRINAATVFDDVPVSFSEQNGEYREYPKNSPNIYDGLITVKDALRLSKNTVAVRLCELRSPRAVFETLRDDYGFETLAERETVADKTYTDVALSPMALGQLTHGVSLRKLTESYGVFPSDGVVRNARSYTVVTDHKNSVVLENPKTEKRVMKPQTARIMNTLLSGVVEDGTAGKITLTNLVETAGKTGTSGNSRDKMFVGYTPYYTAGIWCGYESHSDAVVNISPDHLEIWDSIMNEIHRERLSSEEYTKTFSKEGLIYRSYCKDSGEIFAENCTLDPRGSRVDYAYFSADNLPATLCTRHVLCTYDSVFKGVANERCPRENIVNVALVKIPDRSFPKEIFVTDAEYVYRDVTAYSTWESDPQYPYFYATLSEGEYVGKSKREKQFNCSCNKH